MFGTHRSGFDWKEMAEVLRVTTAAPASFWRELRRRRSKEVQTHTRATTIDGERERDTRKVGKADASVKR